MFEGKPRIVSKIESAAPEGMVRWSVIFTPLIMYYIMMKTKIFRLSDIKEINVIFL